MNDFTSISNSSRPPGCSDNLAFWAFQFLALFAFWPTRHAGFITDWFGWQAHFEAGTWSGALHSFGWRALLPVLFTGCFAMFKFFGTHWLPWFLLFSGLHASAAWLLFRLVRRVLPEGRNRTGAALGTGLLFLLSPYAAEPVVWKACVHYLGALGLALYALHHALDFLEKPARKHLFWVCGLFAIGIFLSEWMVIFPFLLLVFAFAYGRSKGWHRSEKIFQHPKNTGLASRLGYFFRQTPFLTLPPFVLLGAWFGLNKYFLGQWVGHYGASVHLNPNPKVIFPSMMQYLGKYWGFARFWSPERKAVFFDWFLRPEAFWPCLVLVGGFLGWWWLRLPRLKARWQWAGFGLLAFFVCLLPVANLFFYSLLWGENDRYGYFASGFAWMAALLALSGLPAWLFRGLVLALLLTSGALLGRMTGTWREAGDLQASLVRDFRWRDRSEVLILASPDNLRGVHICRIIGEPSGFDEALAFRRHEPFLGKMWEAVQFNMVSTKDALKIERDSSGRFFKISFAQDGNWWWRNGVGASDYETERFIFRKKEWHVEVELKGERGDLAIIYPVGGKWEEVK